MPFLLMQLVVGGSPFSMLVFLNCTAVSLLLCNVFININIPDPVQAVSSCVIPSLLPPTRREEDILFQWRLKRKMEQAREWPQSLQQSSRHGPTFSWQAPISSHPSASGQAYKVGVKVHDIYSMFLLYLLQIFRIILISSFLHHL